MNQPIELTKIIFNGRAVCNRCCARSKRTGVQCNAVAMVGKNTCAAHGGKSTGARSAEGKARQTAANTKTGNYTQAVVHQRSQKLVELAQLESQAREAGVITGPRSRGRSPGSKSQISRSKS